MTKTDKVNEQTHQVPTEEEEEFPARWMRRFRFAKFMWEWWPDHTRLAEFIELVKLVVGDG
jgi:hypothetical protein